MKKEKLLLSGLLVIFLIIGYTYYRYYSFQKKVDKIVMGGNSSPGYNYSYYSRVYCHSPLNERHYRRFLDSIQTYVGAWVHPIEYQILFDNTSLGNDSITTYLYSNKRLSGVFDANFVEYEKDGISFIDWIKGSKVILFKARPFRFCSDSGFDVALFQNKEPIQNRDLNLAFLKLRREISNKKIGLSPGVSSFCTHSVKNIEGAKHTCDSGQEAICDSLKVYERIDSLYDAWNAYIPFDEVYMRFYYDSK